MGGEGRRDERRVSEKTETVRRNIKIRRTNVESLWVNISNT